MSSIGVYRVGPALLAAMVSVACLGCSVETSGSQSAHETADGDLQEDSTPVVSGPEERAVLYEDAVSTVAELAPTILPRTAVEQSDVTAMSHLTECLREDGIRAGLVLIEDDSGAEGNLDACVAVDTTDRGIAYLYVMPSGMDVQPPDERIQAVYLKEGSRVGLIAASFADSMDYECYLSYLDELYEHYDGWSWLAAFDEALTDYSTQLDHAIDYVEYPPDLTRDLTSREWETYDDLIQLIDDGIDEYNCLIETYNAEWEILEAESPLYPEQLFYIETTWEDLLYPVITVPDLPAVPVVPAIPAPSILTPDDYLSRLDQLALVEPPALPDRDECRYERITDNNFVVVDYDVDW